MIKDRRRDGISSGDRSSVLWSVRGGRDFSSSSSSTSLAHRISAMKSRFELGNTFFPSALPQHARVPARVYRSVFRDLKHPW
jgi:hypothetical protein